MTRLPAVPDENTRLRSAMDAASSAFLLFDPQDRLIFASQKLREIYGASDELLQEGCSFENLMRALVERGAVTVEVDRRADWFAERMRLHREGGTFERRMLDGRWRRITEERLADGSYLSHSIDITDLVLQRHELEAARDEAQLAKVRLLEVIEALPAGLSLFDADDRLLLSNRRLREMHPGIADMLATPGTSFEALLRTNFARGGLVFDDPAAFESHLERRKEGRRAPSDKVVFRTLTRWISPIEHRSRDGTVIGIQVDVTELVEQRQAAERARVDLQAVNAELVAARAELEHLSLTDELTGLPNRRRFEARLPDDWARTQRLRQPFSLLMLDVDHFKGFNDRHGHPAGDRCLQRVAKALATTVNREIDLVARYGGEEFVILLPHTDAHGALLVAQACLRAVDLLGATRDEDTGPVTISIGLACVSDPGLGGSPESLLAAADAALLAAKRQGRHRIVEAPPG